MLTLQSGIVLAYAGVKFFPFVFVLDADSGKLAHAIGRVVGGLAVEIPIILVLGLVPFTIRRALSRWKSRT